MAHIKELQVEFNSLPVSNDNIKLYAALLTLDQYEFKPVMEGILTGRIDIEDTRRIFYNNGYFRHNDRNYNTTVKDARVSTDIGKTIADNIQARLFGKEDNIIKESIIGLDNNDLKKDIAKEYTRRTGETLSTEDIDALLPILETQLYVELSLYNPNTNKDKEHQNRFSDLLAYKPKGAL